MKRLDLYVLWQEALWISSDMPVRHRGECDCLFRGMRCWRKVKWIKKTKLKPFTFIKGYGI